MTMASTAAWVSADSRETAPDLTLTAVRSIAPVAATPPKIGAIRLASPCPNSSRLGSCRSATLIESAADADISDSSAPSAATAKAGGINDVRLDPDTKPSEGAGSPSGSVPISGVCRWNTFTATVASTTLMMENGTAGTYFAPSSITTTTATAITGAIQPGPVR